MKRITAVLCLLLSMLSALTVNVSAMEQKETPDYKVSFFAFDCYNMQDENGKRSGYGYEMMQGLAKYLQCTFSYVGYDKTAAQCEEMLRSGEIDLYTAARRTAEREAEFVFSTHPSITSTTCMNIKVGNNRIVAGDYSTYNGLRIGLLQRHTYNDTFLNFVREKGFGCQIVYYDTPTELSNALVNDEVDALVNSYIRIPEDEKTLEDFGDTPYYIMARKEDQALVDQMDYAIDCMNVETPNWRTEMYNKYYGSIENNLELTTQEQAFLQELQSSGETIRAVMNPDANPYSWYEDGSVKGIAADIFSAVAEKLGLRYEILPASNQKEYQAALSSGSVDVWADMDNCYEHEGENLYKATSSYLTTTTSVLRVRGASEKIDKLVTDSDDISIREIVSKVWPDAQLTVADSLDECKRMVLSGKADGALLLSYAAQKLARDDLQNRLRVDIVPGGSLELVMGINARDDVLFYGIWAKTLAEVSGQVSAGIVQEYLEQTATPTMLAYLFDHPVSLLVLCSTFIMLAFLLVLYVQSAKGRRRQEKISDQLAAALEKAEEATRAKQNFFSKMSHDIRTPLNVVLGMTQIAQKYKDDSEKLDSALNNINKEGNYLLVLINSILDVNQLEHGTIELLKEPFEPAACVNETAAMLRTLAEDKKQQLTVRCDRTDAVVVGDKNRLKQILINIATNAIKYTEPGGHIALRLDCLPQDRYRFTCTDDGIGMSADFVQHICEDYTRAEDSRVSKIQGTGLGMSVVKGFTELMGGTLHVESELGKGSTFTVEIPFPAASQQERQMLACSAAEESDRPVDYTGRKVLLAEDNALNAEIAMELLKTVGLSVDWVEDGAQAVRRYEASQPGEYFVIFMDMQMPVMDGVTATQQIRQSGRSDCNVPIFAMTANTFASDRQRCREAGMNGYIAKPISVKDLEKALGSLGPGETTPPDPANRS